MIEFTKEFSKVTAEKAVNDILVNKLQINKLIIGYNHHFGYKREGNFNYLYNLRKNLDFDIEEVKKKEINKNFKISSSEIRNEILKGNMSKVSMMLGYKYFIKGEVIKGDGIGKKLDFPTANIKIHNEDKILPSDGVYAGYAIISDKKFIGMINIGKRPTVEGKERRVEMNIFDYNDILYGKEMKISFIKRIRNEQKFKNLDDLSDQLRKDKLETIKIIEMKKSEIKFIVSLDEKNIPEKIEWVAEDSLSQDLKESKSISLSLWDDTKNTLELIYGRKR